MVWAGRSIITMVGLSPRASISLASKVSPWADEKVAPSPAAAKTSAKRDSTQ